MSNYKTVYICHFFASNPDKSRLLVNTICQQIVSTNLTSQTKYLPIAPQIYFGNFISEIPNEAAYNFVLSPDESRTTIMDMCLDLIDRCDEMWIFGPELSSGMMDEIVYCGLVGKKIRYKLDSDELINRCKELYDSSCRVIQLRNITGGASTEKDLT